MHYDFREMRRLLRRGSQTGENYWVCRASTIGTSRNLGAFAFGRAGNVTATVRMHQETGFQATLPGSHSI